MKSGKKNRAKNTGKKVLKFRSLRFRGALLLSFIRSGTILVLCMTGRRFSFYALWMALFFVAGVPGSVKIGFAQNPQGVVDRADSESSVEKQESNPGTIKFQARAAEADALVSGKYLVRLWGIDAFEGNSALFKLKSRTALDNKIGNKPVQCSVISRDSNELTAQCVNANEEDLSLYMLQQGYVSVDRGSVYGSLFEAPYLQAESQAQAMKRGIWAGTPEEARINTPPLGQGIVVGVAALLFMLVLALGGISVFIMRGFRNVVDVQNQSIDLATRERSSTGPIFSSRSGKIIWTVLPTQAMTCLFCVSAIFDHSFSTL